MMGHPNTPIFSNEIDLSPYINSSRADNNVSAIRDLVDEVGDACKNWGFFQVINHGVGVESRERLFDAAKRFFDQKVEEKRKVKRNEEFPLGYYDTEHTKNVRDWKEVFDFTVEVPYMMPASCELDDDETTEYPNQWPHHPPELRMAATAIQQAIGTLQPHGYNSNADLPRERGNVSMTSIPRRFKVKIGGLSRRECSHKRSSSGLIQASAFQTSVCDLVSTPSNNVPEESPKKSREAALILTRHGESLWNAKNLFAGCVDVPLTQKGVEEAIEAGKRISNIPIDMIFTSALIRAQMTAMLAMTQHRRKKVPIVMHNESEQAKAWSQIFSEETEKQCIPFITAWQLNERMYGELQGLNKQETADKYGKEQVQQWRRSYNIPPPNGESLEMCAARAVAYFKEHIEPQLQAGKNVMIAAHGNSLRSIIMYLDKLTSQEVVSLELSTGIPMLYVVKEGKYIRRGSPAAPNEAGVYAYTKHLARYRQKLDEMVH